MKKKINKFTTTLKEKKKKTKSQTENKNESSNNSENTIYFKSNEFYDILDSWSDYTNWETHDFVNILVMTGKLKFPITMIKYEAKNRKFNCKDANNIYFSIILDYLYCIPQFMLTIEFYNESFYYTLNNKLHKKDFPKPTFTSHKKTLEDKLFVYNLKTEKIEFNFIDSRYGLDICIDIFFLSNETDHIIDKIQKRYNFEKIFKNLEISNVILDNLISVLNLTDSDLEVLKIIVTCKKDDIVFSKIDLIENATTEIISSNEMGYFHVFESGKLIFTSLDQNTTITINNLLLISGECNSLDKFINIVNNAKKILSQIDAKYMIED